MQCYEKITDLHKHIVDKITFKCEKCDGEMRRIPDVLDTWFDSGSMPYAQMHYPFENKEKFEKNFPAEFIAEGVDQTRCWFYYLHVIANGIKEKHAYKNVIVNGIVLAEDGKKMAKKLQNYPDPSYIFEKYSADALRYYLLSSPVMLAENLNFSEDGVKESLRKNVMLLWNVCKFYGLFAGDVVETKNFSSVQSDNILDKWIIARLNQLVCEVSENMDKYNLPKATRPISEFINDLSTWYIRRSRNRFKGGDENDKAQALKTTKHVLMNFSKIIAPVMPFIAEQVWQKVTGFNFENKDKSVHLEGWPNAGKIDKNIIAEMEATRKIVELGLAKRDETGIKVRQPLSKLKVKSEKLKVEKEYIDLIKDELNVKTVETHCNASDKESELKVELDTKLTPELKQEGIKREIVRTINSMRKNAGLTISNRIVLFWQSENQDIIKAIKKYQKDICDDVLADEIKNEKNDEIDIQKEIDLDGGILFLCVQKI